MLSSQQYIHQFEEGFWAQENPERAKKLKAYLKDKFEIIGIDTTARRKVQNEVFKKFGFPVEDWRKLIDELWEMPHREFQWVGVDILIKAKKYYAEEDLPFFEKLIVTKSWWDSVDMIIAHGFGEYFKKFPGKINRTLNYVESDNIWLQRTAILFQLKYKKQTDNQLLSDYIVELSGSKEFFVQKAIGWILREYAKVNPHWVVEFVNSHTLKPLSKREALKNFSLK
ncbi:MAG: DNA alkylation repair protein [Bacteroidales bacterium]|nr:DNA alkylation repair protein [Bacteroidales bacterium]